MDGELRDMKPVLVVTKVMNCDNRIVVSGKPRRWAENILEQVRNYWVWLVKSIKEGFIGYSG